MSNSASHSPRNQTEALIRSTGHSPASSPISPNTPNQPSFQAPFLGMGMNSNAGFKTLSSSWQVWSGNQPSQRNPSGSSASSVIDTATQRDGWASSRPTSGNWELPQSGENLESPQKKEFSSMDPQSPMNRQNRNSANLSASRLDDRSPGRKGGSRYGGVPSPTAIGFNTSSQYGQQLNGNSASYENGAQNTSVDELTRGIRGMAVNDEFAAQGNTSYRPGTTNMPQPNGNVPPMRVVQPQQSRPSFSNYSPQGDYTAYFAGPSGLDYSYSYGSSTDASVYGSPMIANATPSAAGMYSGMTPQAVHTVSSDIRPATGVYYEFSSPRPTSQFFYSAQPLLHYSATPHSPMQSTTVPSMPPATLGDKKRELQYTIQQQQQLSHQLYTSARHSTPSPHAHTYGMSVDYGGQMPIVVPGGALFGAPGARNQALSLYQQTLNHGRKADGANAPGITLRSALLDEFRASKSRKWELRDIFGYIVEFSGDQHGSRFIQQKLEGATSEEKQIVFDEIVPNAALQLIQDVFGNYVIQKMFEHGTQVQKSMLATLMEGHILSLSLQMYGCRVVQKAVEYILPEQQAGIVKELEAHVMRCVKDANGNHVIQKLIERVSPERLCFVQEFRGNVYELSTHPYGCRVLQRCFEHLNEEQTRPLLDELHKYTINLMQDQFGNYVIQFVLENGPVQDRLLIISKLRGQMLQMAKHKFASNVCEKALVTADPDNRRSLIEEIMIPKADGVSPIVTMMKDQYANYVLQRALTVVEGEQKEQLITKIKPQLATMRRYSSAYSKHLVSIERLIEKAGHSLTTPSYEPVSAIGPEGARLDDHVLASS